MIIRDSQSPKGRRVDLPRTPDELRPIRKHLYHTGVARTWREASDASWANRVRAMEADG